MASISPERFTEQAQEALAASQELVRRFKHNQWDVEHVLLALLEQEDSLTVKLLKRLGVDDKAVKQQVEAALEKSPKIAYEGAQIYATPRIPRLLEAASAEAERLKDEFIGAEHLLIAIVAQERAKRPGSFAPLALTRKAYTELSRTFAVAAGLPIEELRVSIVVLRNMGATLPNWPNKARLTP